MRTVYLLMTYNQRAFVREAVRSALAQDEDGLEIIISDDASSDGTFDEIRAAVDGYTGSHRVSLNRNGERLGSVEHLARLVDRVGDAFVIMAHGDDIAAPERTRSLVAAWRREGVSLVSSGARWIDADGTLATKRRRSRMISAERIIATHWLPEMLGATMAFETAIMRDPQPLSSQRFAWGLDHLLPWRGAIAKGFYYLTDPLVTYRRHAGNMSNFVYDRTGDDTAFKETVLANELSFRRLQHADAVRLRRHRPFSRRHRRLVTQIERRILRDVAAWTRLRAQLGRDGFGAVWLPTAEIHARELTHAIKAR